MRLLLQRYPVPSLREELASGPLAVRDALRLLYGIATAVDALSSAGLVARDLNPDRILICPQRGGILADPGIPVELLPRNGAGDPDPTYRSPEQLAGRPIDVRSNVYSLGAILLATLTGPEGARDSLPAPVKAVIGQAMATDPQKRFAGPREFIISAATAFGFRQRSGTESPKRAEAATPAKSAEPRPEATKRRPEAAKPAPQPVPARPTPQPVPAEKPPPPSNPSSRPPTRAPRVRRPSLPRLRAPAMPRLRAPTLSRLHVPAVPRPRPPALPRPSLPPLPRLRAPARVSPAVLTFGVAVVACFLAGTVLGRDTATEAKSTQIWNSAFAIELPADWGKTKVVGTGGIELSGPVAAAPFGEAGAGLVVGRVSDMAALDRRFRAEAERTEVRLGRLHAWQYAGLHPRKDLAATAYLAPTTAAPLLMICHSGRRHAHLRLAQCEDIASTIALREGQPASVARLGRHEEQLDVVMTNLRRERLQGRRRLAAAELASGQARVARWLERAYLEAAEGVEKSGAPEGTRRPRRSHHLATCDREGIRKAGRRRRRHRQGRVPPRERSGREGRGRRSARGGLAGIRAPAHGVEQRLERGASEGRAE